MMANRFSAWWLLGPALAAAGACGGDDGDTKRKTGSGAHEVTAEQKAAYEHVNAATAAALAVMTPYVEQGRTVDRRHGDQLGAGFHVLGDTPTPHPPDGPSGLGPEAQSDVQMTVESSAPSCAQVQWGMYLTATVTYDQCDVGNGVIVDGSLTLWISFGPTTVGTQMVQLSVDDNAYDGTAYLRFAGTDTNPLTILGADLTLDLGQGATVIALDDLTLKLEQSGTTVAGSGSVKSASFDGAFVARDARWASGDCNPSSGEADLDLTGLPAMTAIFKATTPADGKVDAVFGSFEIADYPLLPPCP